MRISGVYKLTFPNNSIYVGKSVDIERRWKEHKDSFIKGTAAKKLQTAYILSGMPKAEVLIKCHPDHIDLMESVFIILLLPALNTNPPIQLSQAEIDILVNSPEYLEFSTSDHVSNIKKTRLELSTKTRTITELDNLVTELAAERTKEEIETAAGEKLVALQENHRKLLEEFEQVLQDLETEKSKTIWQRLFGK